MKTFLQRLGHPILQGVTLAGSLVWLVYLGWIRDPMLEWSLILAGFLLSAALGWWPLISLGVMASIEILVWIFPDLSDRRQIMEEIAVFWALGLGIGVIARSFFQHHESLLLDETHPIRVVTPTREAGRTVVAPEGAPKPTPRTPPPSASQATLEDVLVTTPIFHPSTTAPAPAPMDVPPQPTAPPVRQAPQSLPFSSPQAQPQVPTQPSISLTAAAPLRTQELDIGDFRAWVAAQQAAAAAPPPADIPSGLMARNSTPNSSLADPHSSASVPSGDSSFAKESDPASPYALLLEWYNQFSAWPWQEGALPRRYPGKSWQEAAAQDIRDTLDIWRAGAVARPANPHFDLDDVQNFLRCEQLFVLHRQAAPDLHTLTPQLPVLDWMPAYQEARRAARGGDARVHGLAPDAVGLDTARSLTGRPDALLTVAGQAEVVAVLRPTSIQEPLTACGALAAAQMAVAASLGVPLSGGLVLILLPTFGDRRNQPRVVVVEDLATEFRRLDGALDRMLRILAGTLAPKPQTKPGVCDACGRRHFCPAYAGQRPRLNLSEPPALFARFQP